MQGNAQEFYPFCKEGCSFTQNLLKSAEFTEEASFSDYDLTYQSIFWELDPTQLYIAGSVSFSFTAQTQLNSIQFNLHDSLIIDSIVRNSNALNYAHSSNLVTVELGQTLAPSEQDSFTVYYKGVPARTGSGAFMQILRNDTFPEIWTLSEPYGAMEWWPCKQSLLDKVDSIDITIAVPEGFFPASNGLITSRTTEKGTTSVHYKHLYPSTTYLVGVVVTNYVELSETFHFEDGDSMQLVNLVFPESLDAAIEGTQRTPAIMALYNQLFMPYPFKNEWYGHAQFSRGGGMEHQTMSFIGSFGFELIAHELAHQWFGDYVTLASWQDIFLNEGFATFLSGLAYEYIWPEWTHRFWEVRLARIISEPDGSIFVPDTTEVSRIFNGRLSYFKGAYMLRMLRWELGDDAFFSGVQHYLADPNIAYQFADMSQFIQHMEMAGDTTLTEFFNDWYYGEGYPLYQWNWQQQNDTLYIDLQQTSSDASVDFFECTVPLQIIQGSDTSTLRLKHTQSNQSFALKVGATVNEVLFDPELKLITTNEQATGLESLAENPLNIYPNPAQDLIHISTATSTTKDIVIYNTHGQVMYQQAQEKLSLSLSTKNWTAGTYFVQYGADKRSTQKLVIIH